MNPLDHWRDQLRNEPDKFVAGVLEGWLDRGPWQRAEASDFLVDVAEADPALSEITATAILDWAREKLAWDDRKRLHYGEIAHASQLADAFAVFQRLDAPAAARQLADQHAWFESRTQPMRFDAYLDLHRLLWLATAFRQSDDRFLPRWLGICGQSAWLSEGWQEWLRLGLMGLRKLGGHGIPAEQQALAGLLLFHQRASHPLPAEAAQFEARQFEMLKELFPRGPTYWPSVLAEVRERAHEWRDLPAWMHSPASAKKTGQIFASLPTLQEVKAIKKRIRQSQLSNKLWQECADLFHRFRIHAQYTGYSEFLIKTVSNLAMQLLKRGPSPAILVDLAEWVRLALDWGPSNVYLWTLLADCRRALGQDQEAEDILWEALRRFPDNAHCRTILAELLRDAGKTGDAETLLRETMRDFPDNAHCRTILAELLRDAGKTGDAETLLRETMRDFPDNAHCRTILAELLRDAGKTGDAETLLRETMRDFPDNAHCRNILAELLLKRGETEEAETLLRETMQDLPANELCRNILAVLLLKRGETEEAETLLRETGKAGDAETLLRETMRDFPDNAPCRNIFDDPMIPWASERAEVIRLAFGMERDMQQTYERLRQAAREGGAAELAETALRLLFPEDVPPLAESLRARPHSTALRLLEAGQDTQRGLCIADDAPETKRVLQFLYQTQTGTDTWLSRFRSAVLACADQSPPPILANANI